MKVFTFMATMLILSDNNKMLFMFAVPLYKNQ